MQLAESLEAPVAEGDVIGKVILKIGEETVGECPITAGETVEKRTFLICLRDFLSILTQMK